MARPYRSKRFHPKQLWNDTNDVTVQIIGILMKIKPRTLLTLLCLLKLTGCSAITATQNAFDRSMALVGLGPNNIESVGVLVLLGSKPRAQVVEIAFAYGDAASTILTSATALQWFSERQGYCRSYSTQLDVVRVEVPMGYSSVLTELPSGHELAQSVFVFVQEIGKTDITTFKTPWVQVADGGLSITDSPPGSESAGRVINSGGGALEIC
jgi:hypothetical protein